MKEIIKQYAAYNVWANQKVTEAIEAMPEKLVNESIASSFGSLQLTLAHMWDAESIWWQRIKLSENVQKPAEGISDLKEMATGLIKQSKIWDEWVAKSADAAFEHEFVYRNSKKEQFKQPVYQVLLHLFNHQTYHRGQLVIMMRQLDWKNIPATDFIEFTRRKK